MHAPSFKVDSTVRDLAIHSHSHNLPDGVLSTLLVIRIMHGDLHFNETVPPKNIVIKVSWPGDPHVPDSAVELVAEPVPLIREDPLNDDHVSVGRRVEIRCACFLHIFRYDARSSCSARHFRIGEFKSRFHFRILHSDNEWATKPAIKFDVFSCNNGSRSMDLLEWTGTNNASQLWRS